MLALAIDMKDVERVAQNLRAAQDQIPYAMMLALNDATEATRQHLIKVTWPGAIKQRNASFIAASLTTRDMRASKSSLSTEIYDRLNRGHLTLHAKGGTRTARSGHMAVPVSNVRRGPRGVPQNVRAALDRSNKAGIRIKDAIYTRDRNGRLRLLYVLKTATRVPKRVPFFEDYARIMSRELNRQIPLAFAKAMSTRRAR